MAPKFALTEFVDADGECRYERFLKGLDRRCRAKAMYLERLLAEHGTALTFPRAKHLFGAIHELRADCGAGAMRIYYWQASASEFVLVCGEVKRENDADPWLVRYALDCYEAWKRSDR